MITNSNYQDRYLQHQENKKATIQAGVYNLKKKITNNFDTIINERKSDRIYSEEKITKKQLNLLEKLSNNAPSSCNRQGVYIKTINKPEELDNFLVGGKGWIGKASAVMLFFADMEAYKSPNEVLFMPFLDAGVKAMFVSLIAESMGIKNCIVNPNIRPENELGFRRMYNTKGHKFCIALSLGL